MGRLGLKYVRKIVIVFLSNDRSAYAYYEELLKVWYATYGTANGKLYDMLNRAASIEDMKAICRRYVEYTNE